MNNTTTKQTTKDNRVKNLKSKIKGLQAKLNIANRTIKQQLDYQKELIDESVLLRAENRALNKMEEHYNNQMDIAENEIKRLNQIIFYLETKCLKGFE